MSGITHVSVESRIAYTEYLEMRRDWRCVAKESKYVDKRGARGSGNQSIGARGAHRGGGSRWATIPVNEPTVTLEQPPLHLQRRLLLEIVSRPVYTTAVFIPSAVCVSRRRRVKCLRFARTRVYVHVCRYYHEYVCLCVPGI